MTFRPWIHAGLLLAALAAPSLSVAAKEHRVPVEPGPSLLIDVPDAWHPLDMQEGNETTVAFVSVDDDFQLMITVIDSDKTRSMEQDPASLREVAEETAGAMAPTSVEGVLPVRSLTGPAMHGVWFSATDKADPLPAGEWRYLTQGLLSIDGLPGTFTLLVNADDDAAADKIRAEALAALRTLRAER